MRGTHGFSTNQPRRRRVTLFALGAAGVLIGSNIGPFLASITGIDLFHNVTVSFVLAATIFYLLVAKVFWKVGPIPMLIGSPPDLSGEWEGHLYTDTDTYDSEDVVAVDELGLGLVKMEASMNIAQSWDQIQVMFEGPNSTSESTGATILVDDGAPILTYNYDNSGRDFHEELNQHVGTTTLEYDPTSETLEGSYYTGPNRENRGRIELEHVSE
ncbi:Cap15 family cyclic dinucleotide receptor domain-containing protein [Halorubrum aethiopicum]|uniref:Cap15 family cyclic dinucleotide receptor domain-containing protein n=1 Tax=Halorubrum aethiopicum TaxID=1758255 RepID=UPI000AA50A77|nr:hypothetical protein [Halorubrum aethiopicum]